jgi:DNA (cytosine-5)-methyltransferase 1
MLRVIRETKPRWVIGENVEGIVNINEGMVLRQVLNDLENEGFKSQCIIIPASGIGAWHQRKRIWIIANSSSQRSSSQSIGEHRELDKEIKRKKETRDQSTLCTSSSCSDVPNTNNNGSYRSQWNATKQSSNEQKDRLSFRNDKDVPNTNFQGLERHRNQYELREAKQEKNFIWSSNDGTKKSWWQIESELCGVPNGVSYELDKDRSNRIKSLGNSIVPQIARQIGLAIMEAELNG